MNTSKPNGRGGKREGAGRKAGTGRFGEPTKLVRVPLSKLDEFEFWISQLRIPNVELIRPVADVPQVEVPLFLSNVRAGFPSPADDYVEKTLDMNAFLFSHPAANFMLRVKGDSMQDAGIFEGDILVVDRSIEPADGKIVIAALNGELTVKRLVKNAKGVWLKAENPSYPLIAINEENDLTIWGVVTSIVRKV
jgi:DNA polymerase V